MARRTKPIELRQGYSLSSQWITLIGNARCWHFDAWMLRDTGRELYLVIETRIAGRKLIGVEHYAIKLDGGEAVLVPCAADAVGAAQPVTLDDIYLEPYLAVLNRLHWRVIRPMALAKPRGFTMRSIRFWYVKVTAYEPVTPDMVNYSPYISQRASASRSRQSAPVDVQLERLPGPFDHLGL